MLNSGKPVDLARLDISTYERFERYIENIKSAEYPFESFVTMLFHLPRWVAVSHLRRATRHADLVVVCEAITLLARLSPIDACPRCYDLLDHADPDVRRVVVKSLHQADVCCEDTAAIRLATETNGDVRIAWAELLRDVGTDFILPVLCDIAATDTSVDYEGRPTRNFAARAVKAIEERTTPPG
ncbi:MAG TPA: HEAT repeat domain-containing protein [Urbifossiella sp.]|jgi:hypothetical protein|nr:HEAT repeat domain-containing protein [Urbifossiella sp.]